MAKFLRIFFLTLIFTYHLSPITYHLCAYAQEKIVAIVNNGIITQKDLNDFLNFMRVQLREQLKGRELEEKIQSMKPDLLNRLIEDHLILQEAKKDKVQIEDSRVKARIDEMRSSYDSDAEFQSALRQQGLVQADIEEKTREQMLMYAIIDMKVRDKIITSPSEVTDYYQKNSAQFMLPEGRELESITVEDEKLAQEISDRLKRGENPDDLAQKYSFTLNKISFLKDGRLKKDIEGEIFKLKSRGEISQPIKIEDKYYIFKLTDVIPPRQETLAEAQDKIHTLLTGNKMQQALDKWLDEIKKHSYIKIFPD